jgi:hypothetical protein
VVEELAIRGNGYEELVPDLSSGSRSGRVFLRVDMANVDYQGLVKVAASRAPECSIVGETSHSKCPLQARKTHS